MNRQKKYCLRCNAINPEEAEVCAQCGKSFYEASLQAPPEIQPKVELLPVLPLPKVAPEWKKAYIEPPSTCSSSQAIDQTTDGGYVIAGQTDSLDSGHQAYLVKTDANGNVGPSYPNTWQKIFGGKGGEDPHDIRQTSDGGYIMTGRVHRRSIQAAKSNCGWSRPMRTAISAPIIQTRGRRLTATEWALPSGKRLMGKEILGILLPV